MSKHWVFVEWSENGQYRGGSYRRQYVEELLTVLRLRKERGAKIECVMLDEKETKL